LGGASLALIDRLGIPLIGSRKARADTGFGPGSGKPTKLLTIYVGGGWVPMYLWCPFTAGEIASHIPPVTTSNFSNDEKCFYSPEQVSNADGSGDAPDPENPAYQRLRIPRTFDEEALLAAATAPPDKQQVADHKGWSWVYDGWKVWEKCTVVHGVDKQTADHKSAQVATLCGVAGPSFAVPSLHAWVANAMASIYGDERPLGSVNIGQTLTAPAAANLPPVASPVSIKDIADLGYFLAETKDQAWKGLRNRAPHKQWNYWGQEIEQSIPTNDMDELVLSRTSGLSSSLNDTLFEQIYDTYSITSKQLAKDVVSILVNTPGISDDLEIPYWYNHFVYKHFFSKIGGNVVGDAHTPLFDLALRLLRSDLCSAVHVRVGDRYHDDHSDGHLTHYPQIRVDFELVGRLLAYMNMIPASGGGSLLDETLVLVVSEFGRTWPLGNTCDHWPGDSVCFAGGNTHGNRMIGRYDLSTGKPNNIGFMGDSVNLIDENGDPITRQPWIRDVVYTALHMMGIPNVFLPGGPGRIVGVQQDT
jgi:hypothetical protein